MDSSNKKKAEETHSYILNSSQEMILGMDLAGKITYCNQAAWEAYGYTKAELIGKNYMSLFPREREIEFDTIRSSVLFLEKVSPFESVRLGKNGKLLKVASLVSPIKDEKGKIIGISSMEREIREFRMAESKSQALLETAPDAMVIVNNFGQIILVNAQTEHLFKYTRNELLGKEIETLIPSRFIKKHKPHRDGFFNAPKTRSMGHGFDLYGRKKNGDEFPVEISLSPLKTEEGLFVSAAIRDTTESKKAEKRFRDLLESAPDAMIIVDNSGVIKVANLQTDKLFGYKRKELIGRRIEILMPDRFQKGHPGLMQHYFSNPKTREMGSGLELFGITKGGKEFPIEISLSPLETQEGLLVSAAIRDISDKKRMEKKLKEANFDLEAKVKQRTSQLERQNKELEQFAYIASHDLQEPLRTISSMTDLLAREYTGRLDAQADQYLKYTTDASQRMSDLIKGLLIYSRIGRIKSKKIVDCHQLVGDIIQDLNAMIKESGARITTDRLPKLKGSEQELKVLFQNMISNALKFRVRARTPEVTIAVKEKKDEYEFGVTDNGIGIDPKYFKKIFIIFQRLHTQSEFKGSGIGLSHCKKIVELHGGRIWITSTEGLGSTFHFTLRKHKTTLL
ncbi:MULTISPECIES: PAS domain S-box protein [unclassified Imperialibacter]|uniref:PAS domain S-box protein n=1 Tax=unclassified Imperialibacter TaxID=2629706 RepID=UPI0012587409|nr:MULTISPECIES: PAS domain S-box protein [unclassified Imperialibacter]CAD5252789.1 Histidine kinase sensor protein [Imperialibacter sp. 75]CAD5280999.1 Histidine kinase sensor protein [Imperialibacter sp. 89]VVT28881.1 Histidine kinase sensor protein [Imperialibacter sp. EC-SDR9]